MVEAERYGVTVEFVDAPDDATDEGRMLRDILGIFARHERRRIQERTNRMRRARAKSGMLNPGALPLYGYCWSDEETKARYDIDEQASAVVRRIFEEVAAGVPLNQLARQLTSEGILPPVAYQQAKGIPPGNRRVSFWWFPTTIRRMIFNPSYVGEHAVYRYNRFADRRRDSTTGLMKKRMKVVIRADDDVERIAQPDICPPLVGKELAKAAQARLEQNKREASKSGKAREESLLRGGFAFCGYCNVLMYCYETGGDLRYTCRTHKLRQHAPNVPPCPGGCFTIMQAILDRAV